MKKWLNILFIVIALGVICLILILTKNNFDTKGSCGGVVGNVCPDGYYCKGATMRNEGAGICTKKSWGR